MSRKTQREIIIGERFGLWVVIGIGLRPHCFLCRCDCGTEREVYRYGLIEKDQRRRSTMSVTEFENWVKSVYSHMKNKQKYKFLKAV